MSENMDVSAMLAEQIDRVFTDMVTREALIAAEAGTIPAPLWQELENMGIGDALVAEDAGGVGLSWTEVVPVLCGIGHHAAPVPLGETMLGRWALATAGLEVPAGPLAIAEKMFTLDDAGCLSGIDQLVPWAQQAGNIVAVAARGSESFLCLLRWEDISASCSAVDSRATVDRLPGARINLKAVKPAQCAAAPANLQALGLLPYIAVMRAAQMAGGLDRILALCVEQGNTRVQFGKPIGKFQAIQHQIAELAEHGAAAQVAALFGCRRIDKGDVEYGAAVAKIRTGMSATRCAAIAHQVFGAMGVTDEHILHFLTRRLWQWRNEGGSEHWWSELLGRGVFAAGSDKLWSNLTS